MIDHPNPADVRSATWIPVEPVQPPPPDWKPDDKPKAAKRGGPIAPIGQPLAQMMAKLQERAKSSPKAATMAKARQLMEGCTAGAEPCHRGWIDVPDASGRPLPGARFVCEKKTIFCKHGRDEYVAQCRAWLEHLGLRGKLMEACFLREGRHPSVVEGGNPMVMDAFAKEVYAWAVEGGWKRNPLLLLHGPTGPGKTHCALASLAHFKTVHQMEGKLYNLVRLLRGGSTRDATLEEAMRQEVLILDDLGQEINNDLNRANLYMLVDARVSSWLPTIITTNLDIESIVAHYGEERIDDRLMMFRSVVTNAPSKRTAT